MPPVTAPQVEEETPQASPVEEEQNQETSAEDTSVNWQDFLTDDDEEEEESPPEEISGQEEESAEPEEAPPAEEEPPAEAPPVEEPPPATAAAPQPTEEITPEETQTQDFTEMRAKAEEELAQYYQLSEEDATAFQESPTQFLPKLASRMYLHMYENVVNGIMSALPQMIKNVQAQETAQTTAEQKFYDRWKKLDSEQGRAMVRKFGTAYRTANPETTLDDFIQDVGIQAMVALRLPIEGYEPPVQEETPPTNVPSSPPAGASRPAGIPTGSQNPFVALAEEFEEDDRGS